MDSNQPLPIAHLENWHYDGNVLVGFVTKHPYMKDGTYVHTSTVRLFSRESNVARTLNTVYTLGKESVTS